MWANISDSPLSLWLLGSAFGPVGCLIYSSHDGSRLHYATMRYASFFATNNKWNKKTFTRRLPLARQVASALIRSNITQQVALQRSQLGSQAPGKNALSASKP